jgi:outer membrane protein TolC
MKMSVGALTLSELRTAEKTLLTAQKDYLQAQYNCYLGAKKVILLQQGILV